MANRTKKEALPLPQLGRAAAMISLDAEQIWGFLDLMDPARFSAQYPDTPRAYDKMLDMLCAAGVSATWLVVGGLTLPGSDGGNDPRFSGLPRPWIRPVPHGNEASAPLWYRRSFIRRLKAAHPAQDIGLHGGLTHLIWTDPHSTREVIEWELFQGLKALREISIRPVAFTYTRNQIAHLDLLPSHGFLCYRGRPAIPSERWGRSLTGSALRVLEELGRYTPPPVWPIETGRLWNIPASVFLYPLGRNRSRVIPLRTRLERIRLGLDAAIRAKGVFHFGLHPANLAEHPGGFSLFESILEEMNRRRAAGDIEILTMSELALRMRQWKAGTAPETALSATS